MARREAEIEALKKALCVLDEEDGEIPECAGKSAGGISTESCKEGQDTQGLREEAQEGSCRARYKLNLSETL